MTTTPTSRRFLFGKFKTPQFKSTVDQYLGLHQDDPDNGVDARKDQYVTLVNHYYDLVTDFYEFGWGQSFHFAPREKGEAFKDSLVRHERYLADALRLRPGMRVLDVGCGVGGPMREIARYSGATVVGVNNNAYQIERGERHTERAGLSAQCSFLKADFMNLPLDDNSIDAIYAIEATCHAPDKTALFSELRRVLKKGGEFAGYEWCLTDRYDAELSEHRRVKKAIEAGDGLPDIAYTHEVDRALTDAGFEILESRDRAGEGSASSPWYMALTGRDLTLKSLPRTPVGRSLTNWTTRALEKLRLAPEGTTQVSSFLNEAADALVEGGERGIFTPMYFFHAR